MKASDKKKAIKVEPAEPTEGLENARPSIKQVMAQYNALESTGVDNHLYNLTDDFEHSTYSHMSMDEHRELSSSERVIDLWKVHNDPESAMKQLDDYFKKHHLIGTSVKAMAIDLNIEVNSARKLYATFKERLRRQVEVMDVNTLIADQMGALDVVRQECVKIMLSPTTSPNVKLNAAAKITGLESRRSQILDTDRFFEVRGFVPKDTEKLNPESRAQMMVAFIQQIVTGADIEESPTSAKLDVLAKNKTVDV